MYFKNKVVIQHSSIIHPPQKRYLSLPFSLLGCKLMLRYILFTLRIELFVDQISSTIHHISKSSHFMGGREGASAFAWEMIDDTRDSGPSGLFGLCNLLLCEEVCEEVHKKCKKVYTVQEKYKVWVINVRNVKIFSKCKKIHRKCKKVCGKSKNY